MRKIVVVGVGGAGRTRWADALGTRLGLPVTHLDTLYHRGDRSLAPAEEFAEAQRALIAEPGWILAGNHAPTLAMRLAAADTVVFLDINPPAAITDLLARRRRPEPGGHDRMNPSVLRSVLAYRHAVRPRVRRLIAEHTDPRTPVHTFTTHRAAERWLTDLPTVP
ncbi:topology modulation protein [Embleya sp. NPDC005575]|uniref:topology modulation protein n=1 Tax=Embleya sp. NPDC005575 TaxID=3156892 RepID=UPI0033BA136C